MNIWSKLFKEKKVKFLGRAGMILNYQNNNYFIDSEMSFTNDIDIVIFKDTIRFKDTKDNITEASKKEILDYLVDYLIKKEKLRIKLFP
jgi:hypothetical protein